MSHFGFAESHEPVGSLKNNEKTIQYKRNAVSFVFFPSTWIDSWTLMIETEVISVDVSLKTDDLRQMDMNHG